MSARKTDDVSGERAAHDADDAGLRKAPVFDTQRIELALDQCLRLVLFKAQLRMAMDGAAKLDDAVDRGCGRFFDHSGPLRRQYEASLRAKARKQ